jgi:hypothetical protein
MSLEKNRPNYGPTHFLTKLMHNFRRGKKQHTNLGYFCNFQNNCPKEAIAPIVENLLNLVTLCNM